MATNNTAPIGVFDSGLGGLTAVRELRRILPGEDIVYFGDTGRVPYGTKGREVIINYAKQDIALLLEKGVKYIVAACGTVSSTLPFSIAANLPVGFTGIVPATVAAAVSATKNHKIGVIGTEATIHSNSFQTAIAAINPAIQVYASACPLFVPLVENGHYEVTDPLVQITAKEYLAPLQSAGIDTLILGCTHYPLLQAALQQVMGAGVTLINSGREAALALQSTLATQGLLSTKQTGGHAAYYVTDDPARFNKLASVFLGQAAIGSVEWADIEKYSL